MFQHLFIIVEKTYQYLLLVKFLSAEDVRMLNISFGSGLLTLVPFSSSTSLLSISLIFRPQFPPPILSFFQELSIKKYTYQSPVEKLQKGTEEKSVPQQGHGHLTAKIFNSKTHNFRRIHPNYRILNIMRQYFSMKHDQWRTAKKHQLSFYWIYIAKIFKYQIKTILNSDCQNIVRKLLSLSRTARALGHSKKVLFFYTLFEYSLQLLIELFRYRFFNSAYTEPSVPSAHITSPPRSNFQSVPFTKPWQKSISSLRNSFSLALAGFFKLLPSVNSLSSILQKIPLTLSLLIAKSLPLLPTSTFQILPLSIFISPTNSLLSVLSFLGSDFCTEYLTKPRHSSSAKLKPILNPNSQTSFSFKSVYIFSSLKIWQMWALTKWYIVDRFTVEDTSRSSYSDSISPGEKIVDFVQIPESIIFYYIYGLQQQDGQGIGMINGVSHRRSCRGFSSISSALRGGSDLLPTLTCLGRSAFCWCPSSVCEARCPERSILRSVKESRPQGTRIFFSSLAPSFPQVRASQTRSLIFSSPGTLQGWALASPDLCSIPLSHFSSFKTFFAGVIQTPGKQAFFPFLPKERCPQGPSWAQQAQAQAPLLCTNYFSAAGQPEDYWPRAPKRWPSSSPCH